MSYKITVDEQGFIVGFESLKNSTSSTAKKQNIKRNVPGSQRASDKNRTAQKLTGTESRSMGSLPVISQVPLKRLGQNKVKEPKKPLVPCQSCGSYVRVDRLDNHMRKQHKMSEAVVNTVRKAQPVRPSQKQLIPKPKMTQVHKTHRAYDKESQHLKEALGPSTLDTRDGGKFLGHMRRDVDGTYGSLPLYDDYSEESGPY